MIRFKAIHQVAAIAILLGWAAMPANAQVLTLVSEAEVSADRAAQPPPGIRGAPSRSAPNPDAPRIEIMAPQIAGAPLVTPFAIDVRFSPAAGHAINPATLKILYGRLGLDITSRILSATPVTPQGLNVPNARVPKGWHRLLLEIRDDADNIGRSEIEFEVSN